MSFNNLMFSLFKNNPKNYEKQILNYIIGHFQLNSNEIKIKFSNLQPKEEYKLYIDNDLIHTFITDNDGNYYTLYKLNIQTNNLKGKSIKLYNNNIYLGEFKLK